MVEGRLLIQKRFGSSHLSGWIGVGWDAAHAVMIQVLSGSISVLYVDRYVTVITWSVQLCVYESVCIIREQNAWFAHS